MEWASAKSVVRGKVKREEREGRKGGTRGTKVSGGKCEIKHLRRKILHFVPGKFSRWRYNNPDWISRDFPGWRLKSVWRDAEHGSRDGCATPRGVRFTR